MVNSNQTLQPEIVTLEWTSFSLNQCGNNIRNDYHFSHLETNPVPSSLVIRLVSRARMIERILLAQNQFSVSMELLQDESHILSY